MERKRKAYLLRKSDFLDHLNYNPQINGNAACSCNNKSSARSYDLQTQTITFEDENRHPKDVLRNGGPVLKNFNEDNPKVPDSCSTMDQDLEFYPIDDHPSPSTFTAWDAFLAGNQAFFREPPGLLPDPAFSYMDVIPEEDDMEALLESDTDDTGSSVSTVIDRFSRTSTANSSFSERCKGTADVTFDLQKVLSPFERLEKELDADDSKDDHEFSRRKISRGPIVVITNSSSCEDVHSAEEEEEEISKPTENEIFLKSSEKPLTEDITISPDTENDAPNLNLTLPLKEERYSNSAEKSAVENIANNTPKSDVVKTPPVPARSKIVNGSKSVEKDRTKSDKKDSSSISAIQKKKSYPTPNVPPRMSKHLPARRTRSDPGTTDQPSRIPRPISSSSNRSSSASTTPKSNPKSNRSPKIGIPKKLKFTESLKSNRNASSTAITTSESALSVSIDEATTPIKVSTTVESKAIKYDVGDCIVGTSTTVVSSAQDDQECDSTETNNQVDEIEASSNETAPKSENIVTDTPENLTAQILDLFPSELDFIPSTKPKKERPTNPFRNADTNPFKTEDLVELKNPFVKHTNPFEECPNEETPALQPKGQIAASLIPPPIPERPSLKLAEKRESKTELNCQDIPQVSQDTGKSEQETNNEETLKHVDEKCLDTALDSCVSADIPTTTTENHSKSTPDIIEAIEKTLSDMEIIDNKSAASESKSDIFCHQTDDDSTRVVPIVDKGPGSQRPIEDILQALDQLVLSAPREVEISIDWGARGPVNIREKAVLPSDSSVDRSDITETDGLTDDRRRDIETLLKEVDECLRLHKDVNRRTMDDLFLSYGLLRYLPHPSLL